MAASTDLWGEIEAMQIRTPLVILREQAALLGAKTKNLVEASVSTRTSGGQFVHKFNLIVPALDHYTYNLFTIRHGPTELYPVTDWDNETRFDTEAEFINWLSAKLSAPETKRIIGNLLAQVAA